MHCVTHNITYELLITHKFQNGLCSSAQTHYGLSFPFCFVIIKLWRMKEIVLEGCPFHLSLYNIIPTICTYHYWLHGTKVSLLAFCARGLGLESCSNCFHNIIGMVNLVLGKYQVAMEHFELTLSFYKQFTG